MSADNRVQVVARMPPALRDQAQAYADHYNITLSRAVENLVRHALTVGKAMPWPAEAREQA